MGCVPSLVRKRGDRHFEATFDDGYRSQAVIDAVEQSVESRVWTRPETLEREGV
jgi:hypothetical protein